MPGPTPPPAPPLPPTNAAKNAAKALQQASQDAIRDSGTNFWDGINFAQITPTTLGMTAFGSFVNAALANPSAINAEIGGPKAAGGNYVGAVGENSASGSTSTVFWAYTAQNGLHLEAEAGFLNTATGNGGFTLDVGTDGSWDLKFAGSTQTAFWDAKDQIGSGTLVTAPPAGNTVLDATAAGKDVLSGAAGHMTVDGTGGATPVGAYDTVQGGVGDYIIGGTLPHADGAAGNSGNCALYSSSPGSVLVDMQNDNGYGGSAEGDTYSGMNQVRGSLQSNVLIGNASGTDLKSGGDDSILISTGGSGNELRPDGTNTTLVSTVGADRVLFDPSHGWALGDTTTLLGFNAAHGVEIDLSLIASGIDSLAETGNLNNYVSLLDTPAGEQVMFSPTGSVASNGVDVLNMALQHGDTAQSLFNSHNLVI